MSWDKVRLGEVCKSIADGDHQSPPKATSGIPFVTISNITEYNDIEFDGVSFVPQSYYDSLDSKRKAQANDVLYSVVGSYGIPVFVDDDVAFAFQRHIAILRPNCEIVNPRFLYYVLKSNRFYQKMDSVAIGSAQKTITLTILRNAEIDLPPRETQDKIARILSRYDALVANCRKQIKLLEEAAERLYKEWFIDLRFPGSETSTLNEQGLPDGWEVRPLNEVAPIVTGKKDANYGCDKGKYPFFTCAKEAIKAPGYSFDGDAVILAGNGDFSVKMFRGKFEAYQRTYVLMPSDPKMLYLLYFSVLSKLQSLVSGASGSTIKFLTKGMIESLQVIVPEQSIFEQFYEAQQSFLRGIEIAKSTLSLLTEARDRLLPKLMSGEIEV